MNKIKTVSIILILSLMTFTTNLNIVKAAALPKNATDCNTILQGAVDSFNQLKEKLPTVEACYKTENLANCQNILSRMSGVVKNTKTAKNVCIENKYVTSSNSNVVAFDKIVSSNTTIQSDYKKIKVIDSTDYKDYYIWATSCGSIEDIPRSLPRIIRNLYDAIKILVPIVIIFMGILDFAKAVLASDESKMSKSISKFIRRIIAGLIVFFVLAITEAIFGLVADSGKNGEISKSDLTQCIACFISNSNACGPEYQIKD